MTPWSVRPRAGWPKAAARAASASTLHAPSRSEYSEWTCRWAQAGLLTALAMLGARSDGVEGALCGGCGVSVALADALQAVRPAQELSEERGVPAHRRALARRRGQPCQQREQRATGDEDGGVRPVARRRVVDDADRRAVGDDDAVDRRGRRRLLDADVDGEAVAGGPVALDGRGGGHEDEARLEGDVELDDVGQAQRRAAGPGQAAGAAPAAPRLHGGGLC